MTATPDELGKQLGIERWTDSQLLRLLGQKAFEVNPFLAEVSTLDAFVIGAETLLRTETRIDGVDMEFPTDPMLAAMVYETRKRIGQRVPQEEVSRG